MNLPCSIVGALFLSALGIEGAEPTKPTLEPVFRWAIADGSERFVARSELTPAQHKLTNSAPAFLAVPPGECWPELVPVFAIELADRFELRRRPLRGQENSTEPVFFALPLEDESVAPKIAGRWQVTATRSSGSDAWFQWELTAEGDKIYGRFDQSADYRVASFTGGAFRSNRVELSVEYTQNKYALTGEWRDGKLRGTWRETENAEHGRWEAERLPAKVPPPPAGEVVPLHEWQRGTERRYGIVAPGAGWTNLSRPLCRVWKPAVGTRPVFAQRGYYLCFMRMPTFGLEAWQEILDGAAEDGANTIILWMGGGFRSKKFPITWQWAKEHANVKTDFARELIGHAHRRGIKVLLGFTPFGYDGVNQYPLEHPELKATGADGKPVREFGIGCWGWNLCPAQAESQRFMREYAREMAFEFYPEADGLFIESSDYAICHCAQCGPKFFDHEFAFVRDISNEVWARKPEATVVVYPHYFSGAKLRFSFSEATAAKQPFDPRWTLFFTPHSAALEPALIAQARGAWWSDAAPARFEIANLRANARKARDGKCSGYVPSLECFTYVPVKPEFDEPWIVGRRQIPFGFGWLKEGENPYRELPVRAIRLAWREFTANPDLSDADLRARLGRELFSTDWQPAYVDDLLFLYEVFNTDRDWSIPGALTAPNLVRSRAERGKLDTKKRAQLRDQITRVRAVATRHRDATNSGAKELHRIAQWLSDQWTADNASLLHSP